jgi:hypothetical protein
MQLPTLQLAKPGKQLKEHAEFKHVGAALAIEVVQALPHPLQLFGSEPGFEQVPMQQLFPTAQATPTSPQFAGSEETSTTEVRLPALSY